MRLAPARAAFSDAELRSHSLRAPLTFIGPKLNQPTAAGRFMQRGSSRSIRRLIHTEVRKRHGHLLNQRLAGQFPDRRKLQSNPAHASNRTSRHAVGPGSPKSCAEPHLQHCRLAECPLTVSAPTLASRARGLHARHSFRGGTDNQLQITAQHSPTPRAHLPISVRHAASKIRALPFQYP